jgi:hypothetical protein
MRHLLAYAMMNRIASKEITKKIETHFAAQAGKLSS